MTTKTPEVIVEPPRCPHCGKQVRPVKSRGPYLDREFATLGFRMKCWSVNCSDCGGRYVLREKTQLKFGGDILADDQQPKVSEPKADAPPKAGAKKAGRPRRKTGKRRPSQ